MGAPTDTTSPSTRLQPQEYRQIHIYLGSRLSLTPQPRHGASGSTERTIRRPPRKSQFKGLPPPRSLFLMWCNLHCVVGSCAIICHKCTYCR
ncbi:hypothetical protein K437DRAFT_70999 [Tilletiaria anomala UBC 951]|uniref:Uncharacterized protein n=1 Tax=Tilletiaria anomala (strain ATCC 24038 / CBS 436.72 / UBC 951) TaxID=1037660 RepID=A0A066WHF9_TILAU|nr:uncharacterized protein K437DRAFT_70999 [Tilletiaria anomala UBC 951]KDN53417.1 hypothetical protein K437DRAFT_70999 [Tilletiaria anomala UBC 951]